MCWRRRRRARRRLLRARRNRSTWMRRRFRFWASRRSPRRRTSRRRKCTSRRRKQNVAQYGEQKGSVMPRQMQVGSAGPTTVGRQQLCQPVPVVCGPDQPEDVADLGQGTGGSADAKGRAGILAFTIYRDGSHGRPRIDTSSGSPTLDNSCLTRSAARGHVWPASRRIIIKAR